MTTPSPSSRGTILRPVRGWYLKPSKRSACRCILAPPRKYPRPSVYFFLTLDTGNLRLFPRQQQTQTCCPSRSNRKKRAQSRSENATKLYMMTHRKQCPVEIGDLGVITFTKHVKYLGGYCSYSLKDDYDVNERLSQASSAMGALNIAVNDYSKYLIF